MSQLRRGARWLGPVLFGIYCACYAAFVLSAAFCTFEAGQPVGGLAAQSIGGLNVAVVAGFGLILGAFVLALVYARFGAHRDAAEKAQ